jgi:hypothetical protein
MGRVTGRRVAGKQFRDQGDRNVLAQMIRNDAECMIEFAHHRSYDLLAGFTA